MAKKAELVDQNNFLPEGYKRPLEQKKEQFLKFEVGDNVIRFLMPPVLGFVVFTSENKPVRKAFEDGEFTVEEMEDIGAKKEDGEFIPSKHFWAAPVWSFKHELPKIMEITQSSIQKEIQRLNKDEDWGNPMEYNININKVGTTKNDTEYSVTPKPRKELTDKVKEFLSTVMTECKPERILSGDYPFETYNFDNNEG